jgi:hypothetical protein
MLLVVSLAPIILLKSLLYSYTMEVLIITGVSLRSVGFSYRKRRLPRREEGDC